MKAASRSKMSISGSVASPWIRSGMPIRSIRSSTGAIPLRSVTPACEFVVAPAGYSLAATQTLSRKPRSISSGSVSSRR